jgi:hypothetical protein
MREMNDYLSRGSARRESHARKLGLTDEEYEADCRRHRRLMPKAIDLLKELSATDLQKLLVELKRRSA